MSHTMKPFSELDANQIIRKVYSEAGSLSVEGWIFGKVGRKILSSVTTTTVPNDTEVYTYSEDGVDILKIKTVYTDATRGQMLYSENIALV